MPVGITLCE